MKKTFKKVLAVLLCAVMLFGAAPVLGISGLGSLRSAAADTSAGSCGQRLTWTLNKENGALVITGSGDMANYQKDEINNISTAPWGAYASIIKSVSLPAGLTRIGDYAFYRCMINAVYVPDTCLSIGNSAFLNCAYLSSIDVPDTITSIGSHAFEETKYYTDAENWTDTDGSILYVGKVLIRAKDTDGIKIRTNTRCIADGAFDNIKKLTAIEIPKTVTDIGVASFSNCTALQTVTMYDSIVRIGDLAFSGCSALNNVDVLNLTPAVSNYDINLPSKLTDLGVGIFRYCTAIKSAAIPTGIHSIPGSTFLGCTALEKVFIPDAISIINIRAFADCGKLTKINPDALKDVNIPQGVKIIDTEAFSNSGLVEVEIPRNVTTLGTSCFAGSKKLKKVIIPNSITVIAPSLFEGCSALKDISIPDSEKPMDLLVDEFKPNFIRNIPDTITSIGRAAFKGTGIEYFNVSEKVTTIGEEAFEDCENLIHITIPESVVTIQQSAFKNDSNLEYVCYGGTPSAWRIAVARVGNDALLSQAAIYYHSHTNEQATTIKNQTVTCENDGYSGDLYFECDQQWEKGHDTTALGHDWIVTNYPDEESYKSLLCKQDIFLELICRRCGKIEKNIIPAGHDLDMTTPIEKKPTCTEDGYTGYVCKKCGEVVAVGDSVPATGHSFGAWQSLNDEKHVRICGDCHETETASHTFGSWVITKPATQYAFGSEQHSCSICGKTVTRTIDPLPSQPLTLNAEKITVYYKDATTTITASEPVTWQSSNDDIVGVSAINSTSCYINTKTRGTVFVFANSVEGGKDAFCTVTVKYHWWQWLIMFFLFGWIWY